MKKKIALITGASGGIGGACAETLARAGYTVLLHGCHGLEHAKALADRLCAEGCDAHAVCCDLADSESVQAMCRDVLALYHRVDALALCAGISHTGLLCDMTDAQWRAVMDVNVSGMFYLIRALAPLHRSGVPICVHMRQEGDGVVDALREMLEVARALQTPLEVSHLKAIGSRNARKAVPQMLSLIEKAREDGLDVMCDVYPYTAGSTQLIHVLPPEFQEGGTEALTKRLLDDAARKEMRARMEAGSDFENITLLVGFDNVVAIGLRTDEYRRFEGKSVAEIAQTLQKDPFDTLFDLLAAEQCNTGMIDYISDEEDVKDILRAPFSGVISDATYPSGGRVHPRVYGTFARLIEKYVVQERVLTLEQAVHKVTGHAADRFGFEKKGVIAAGMDADLLLFSPENVREHGTYARPNLPATGFDEVFVLGERVIENGVYRGGSSGEMLGARMGY